MKYNKSLSYKLFQVFNTLFLISVTFMCLFPMLHILAMSLSDGAAVEAGKVLFWPVNFTTKAYEFVVSRPEYLKSFLVSLERVAIGVPVNMALTILAAYPLSRNTKDFKSRNFYAWFFIATMLFNGGLIPTYITVYKTGLIDSIWALVLPSALPVYNLILLYNFFKELPVEIEESAFMDGAGHWRTLWSIYIPLSKPSLATLVLFCIVAHWNSWFDGILYMNRPVNYPLQSYLQTVVIQLDLKAMSSMEEITKLSAITQRNTRAAKIFVAIVPILGVYPFLQKYFTKGIVLGSVKG